jgi:GTPase
VNQTLLLGPHPDNSFRECIIRSIHCKRVPVVRSSGCFLGCFLPSSGVSSARFLVLRSACVWLADQLFVVCSSGRVRRR